MQVPASCTDFKRLAPLPPPGRRRRRGAKSSISPYRHLAMATQLKGVPRCRQWHQVHLSPQASPRLEQICREPPAA